MGRRIGIADSYSREETKAFHSQLETCNHIPAIMLNKEGGEKNNGNRIRRGNQL